VLRALVSQGRATTRDGDHAGLRRLVTLPNAVLWQVLNYWRVAQLPGTLAAPDKSVLGLAR
jgi:hypothetical protein